jgi:phosphoribosyl 1,2-cyclic phosphate phosphodiesterase
MLLQKINIQALRVFEIKEIGNEPFIIENTEITPIQVIHYKLPILGYKFQKPCLYY